MKKQTSIFAALCISLFFIAPFASAGVEPTVNGWTWSEDLREGAYFAWEVSMYNDTNGANTPVTTPGDDGPGFVNGSYMEVWVNQDPYGLQFPDDEAQFSNFFGFNLDGNTTYNPELTPVLVFPNTYQTNSGDYNYFHYIVDFDKNFTMFDNENSDHNTSYEFFGEGNDEIFSATIEVFHDDSRNVTETFQFGSGDGVLRSFDHHEVYTDGTVLQAAIQLVHYEDGNSGDDDFLEFAHFDDSLDAGDSFSWEVLTIEEGGVQITVAEEDGQPLVGSIIRLEIVGEPEDLSFTDENLVVEDYFEFYVDDFQLIIQDTFDGPGDFIQFVFPKVFDFENGTVLDFFEFAAANPEEVWDSEQNDVMATLSNGVFHLQQTEVWDDGWQSTMDIEFDANNGVMLHLHRTEMDENGVVQFEMEFDRVDGGNPTDNTSDEGSESEGDLPLPGFAFYMIIPAFIAIPILRRK